jgi:hypothetical protein
LAKHDDPKLKELGRRRDAAALWLLIKLSTYEKNQKIGS